MVLLLLQHGADVTSGTTELDNTALVWATKKCSYATVKALLDAGSDPWHRTKVQTATSVHHNTFY